LSHCDIKNGRKEVLYTFRKFWGQGTKTGEMEMIVEVLKWSNENRRDETQDFPYFKVLLNPNSPWAEGKQGPNTNNKHRQIILQEDDY
jgi:hypothetical protein